LKLPGSAKERCGVGPPRTGDPFPGRRPWRMRCVHGSPWISTEIDEATRTLPVRGEVDNPVIDASQQGNGPAAFCCAPILSGAVEESNLSGRVARPSPSSDAPCEGESMVPRPPGAPPGPLRPVTSQSYYNTGREELHAPLRDLPAHEADVSRNARPVRLAWAVTRILLELFSFQLHPPARDPVITRPTSKLSNRLRVSKLGVPTSDQFCRRS